jgi:predicted phosphodiesterase
LILRNQDDGTKIFLAHGHQGDCLNDQCWWIGRSFVKNLWKPLQNFGVKDPTRPAKNLKKRERIEKEIIKWANTQKQVIIVGHIHRPAFPTTDPSVYFNTGSSVHPRCITGIEIVKGEIALIKWFIDVRSDDKGSLFINREILEGSMKLQRKS